MFYFFHHPAPPEIYTLSLHDAFRSPPDPHLARRGQAAPRAAPRRRGDQRARARLARDRKSTRLNSSHTVISYAVFCLKKKRTIVSSLVSGQLATRTGRCKIFPVMGT